jgi:hypothetical protein
MIRLINTLLGLALSVTLICCHSTRKLSTAVNKKDTTVISTVSNVKDSSKLLAEIKNDIYKNHIDFKTFSAKIKVQYEDGNGKQPDVNAFIRMTKDSIIWMSVNATFLNIEAFRILVTKDSIFILDKLHKLKSLHPISFLEDVAHISLDLHTLQELIIGNPIYVGDKIVSFKKTENRILISTVGELFKNLITISADNDLILRSKMDDLDVLQNRTADLTYGEYESLAPYYFPTYREITVAEKTKVDVILFFKQYEFNKDLSYPFNIPKTYKLK